MSPLAARAGAVDCRTILADFPGDKSQASMARIADAGHLVLWRDNRAGDGGQPFLTLVDSLRRVAAPWPSQGLKLGTAGSAATGITITGLGGKSAIVAWGSYLGAELEYETFSATVSGPLSRTVSPSDVIVDSVVHRLGSQIPVAVIPQDLEHGLVVVQDQYEPGRSRVLIKEVALPGSPPGAWPRDGLTLSDDAGMFPAGIAPAAACTDDSAGCMVVTAGHTPLDPFHSSITYRLSRLLSDGSADPRWPPLGRVLTTDGDEFNQEVALVPDGLGGVYFAWTTGSHTPGSPVRVMLQRVDRDGNIHPGWPAEGVIAVPSTAMSYQWFPRLVAGSPERVALLVNENDETHRLKVVAGDGTAHSGWPDSGLVLGSLNDTPLAGRSRLVATDEATLVAAWTSAPGDPASPRALLATSVTWMGEVLEGWSANGNRLCSTATSQVLESVNPSGSASFATTWVRGPGILEFGSFNALDGSLALGVEMHHLDFSVAEERVITRWTGNAPDDMTLFGMRRVNGGAWEVRDSVQRDFAGEFVLKDAWPAGMTTVDYALGVAVASDHQSVSDTLRIRTATPASALHLEMESVQSGRSLWMYLTVGTPGQAVEVRAYDVNGRRLAVRKLSSLPAGTHRVELELPTPRQGIVFVRASSSAGSSAARTALLN